MVGERNRASSSNKECEKERGRGLQSGSIDCIVLMKSAADCIRELIAGHSLKILHILSLYQRFLIH